MSENLTFAEIEAQHVELLPARTVLSMISVATPGTPGTPGKPGGAIQGLGFNIWSGPGATG